MEGPIDLPSTRLFALAADDMAINAVKLGRVPDAMTFLRDTKMEPVAAAREVVEWIGNGPTRILDASSAHRVAERWAYGLPELASGQRDTIRAARLVSNPGCYPTAFVLLTRPLVDAGLVPESGPLSTEGWQSGSG